MKKSILTLFILWITGFGLRAQTTIIKQDPEINKMVEEVSAKNLETIVRKLRKL